MALIATDEMHAYLIKDRTNQQAGSGIHVTSATLHHALKRLLRDHCIEIAFQQNNVNHYTITGNGRRIFEHELKRLERIVTLGRLAKNGGAIATIPAEW